MPVPENSILLPIPVPSSSGPEAIDVRRRPYSPPDIAWIELVEVKRNLAAACAKADPFRCSDNPSAHLS